MINMLQNKQIEELKKNVQFKVQKAIAEIQRYLLQ